MAFMPMVAAPGAWTSSSAWLEALKGRDTARLSRLAAKPSAPVAMALEDGTTALMVASKEGPLSLVARLLELGADVRAENSRSGTALMYAAIRGDPPILRRLLEEGARINHQASNGWSALTIAAAKGRTGAVRLLLDLGADPNLADIYGGTPLTRAVEGGYGAAVRVLLESGVLVVDAEDESGATALHHAAAYGDPDLVRLLLDYGADPSHRTGKGFTPADVARMSGHDEAAAVLAREPSR